MSKEEARDLNRFHVIVALHHLRAIVPDMVPRQSVSAYINALRSAEALDIELGPVSDQLSALNQVRVE